MHSTPLPSLSASQSERLFTEFSFPRPDPANRWNTFDQIYSNAEMMLTLDRLAGLVQSWVSERTATSDRPPLVIGMLHGCAPLYLWLLEKMQEPRPDACTVKVSTYDGSNVGGSPVIMGALPDVTGRHVLLVDDMGDTFRTEQHVKRVLVGKGALSVASCVLLVREAGSACLPEFFGRELKRDRPAHAEDWLIGMGLDGHDQPDSRVVCDADGHFVIRHCPKIPPEWIGDR